jgi:hypothetical protein
VAATVARIDRFRRREGVEGNDGDEEEDFRMNFL